MQSGETLDLEEENVGADGVTNWVHVLKAPVRSPSGAISGVQCSFWDVTARRAAEEHLHRSEERFQAIMDQTPAVVA
jgi:PAS domain S-box-containing protein